MSKVLAIDYGRKKIGLAISDGSLAEPYKVIRFKSEEEALKKVEKVVSSFAKASEDKKVEKIVVGISEGRMGEEARAFGKKFEKQIGTPVVFQDETMTTKEAQELSIKAGIKRKKRRELEDAYAATLILQAYLDSH